MFRLIIKEMYDVTYVGIYHIKKAQKEGVLKNFFYGKYSKLYFSIIDNP